jgi:NADPH-dependent 2,4-dienoyl-CoA reductase/sulfur reductase-like enzyme
MPETPATALKSTRPSASTPSSASSATKPSAKGWAFDPAAETLSGKRVLVIGAGPSGLSAAYHLRRLGHEVTSVMPARWPAE